MVSGGGDSCMNREGVHHSNDRPPSRLLNVACLLFPLVSFATIYRASYYSPAVFALIAPYTVLAVIAYGVSMMFNSQRVSRAAFMLFIGCLLVDVVCIAFTVFWYLLWTSPGTWVTK